ncbi:hypothetical protein C8F01DRAFT_1169306 [Mycena amicta]|nr:hypothetical protein C8F01DRAFT_1169306 [Mycena amicta]
MALLPKRRTDVPPPQTFPTELWEHILGYIDPDSALLALAGVSRTFRELCVSICFRRNGIASSDLNLHIPTTTMIHAFSMLAASRGGTLPVQRLFYEVKHSREAQLMQSAIRHLRALHDLQMSFSYPALRIGAPQERAALSTLCTLISEMASRQKGPVMVILANQIFTCRSTLAFHRAKDVAKWRLDRFEYNPPLLSRLRWRLGLSHSSTRSALALVPTKTCTYNGDIRPVQKLTFLSDAQLTLIVPPGRARLSLLTFNSTTIRAFGVGHSKTSPTESTLAELNPYLSDILLHLSLPVLGYLYLYLDTVTVVPSALRTFLVNHPGIKRIEYYGAHRPSASSETVLFTPPLAMPSLSFLHTAAVEGHPTMRLVPALINSPLLCRLSFAVRAYASDKHSDPAPFFSDLRSIAACGRTGLTLELSMLAGRTASVHSQTSEAEDLPLWTDSEDAKDAARAFASADTSALEKVEVIAGSTQAARHILPWIALLRAADSGALGIKFLLRISPHPTPRSPVQLKDISTVFLKEARNALPQWAVVSCTCV